MAGKDAFQINKINLNPQLLSGVILGTSFLVGGVCFLNPFVSEGSYAADTNISVSYSGEDWTISAPTSTASATGLDFDITGNPAGVNMAKKDTVTSGTTNVPDYQIYVSVNTTDGAILNTSDSAYAIAATSGTVADATSDVSGAATLSNNSWGYALSSFNTNISYDDLVSSSSSESWSSSKWAKLPYVATANIEDDTTIESDAAKIYDSTSSSDNSVDVYYAVNANNDLASGEYETTVTYTLIGEIPTVTLKTAAGAAGITTMQGMQDPSVCANAGVWQEGEEDLTLTDTRDNESYVIRKLKDGNCWMASNLRLTYDTLNNNSSRTSPKTTLTSADTDINGTTADFAMPANQSWSASSAANGKLLKGAMSASNSSAKQTSSKTAAATGDVAAARGTYYSWCTATVDCTDDPGMGKTQPSSICPKGWKLPNSDGTSTADGGNQFYKPYNAYAAGNQYTDFMTAYNYYYSKGATYYLAGNWSVFSSTQYVSYPGSYGNWWSSTSHSTNADSAWYLSASTSSVNPASNFNRYLGLSVRCVLNASVE